MFSRDEYLFYDQTHFSLDGELFVGFKADTEW